mgnify:CR=1 FL=1
MSDSSASTAFDPTYVPHPPSPPPDPRNFRFGKYAPRSGSIYVIPRGEDRKKCKVMYEIAQRSNHVTFFYVMCSLDGTIFLEQELWSCDRIQSDELEKLFAIVQESNKIVANLLIREIVDNATALDNPRTILEMAEKFDVEYFSEQIEMRGV